MKSEINLFFILLFLSGCASTLHTPMSEMLMFQKKKSVQDSTYFAGYSHALVSYSVDSYSSEKINNYAKTNRPLTDVNYDYSPTKSVTTNLVLMPNNESNAGFSLAIGNPIGIDLTANIFGKTYLTGALSLNGESPNSQIILQQRLFNRDSKGFSLGIAFQRKLIMVDTPEGCPSFYCSENFESSAAGVRSVFLISSPSEYGKSRFYIQGIASVNYDFVFETIFPRVGVSIGLY